MSSLLLLNARQPLEGTYAIPLCLAKEPKTSTSRTDSSMKKPNQKKDIARKKRQARAIKKANGPKGQASEESGRLGTRSNIREEPSSDKEEPRQGKLSNPRRALHKYIFAAFRRIFAGLALIPIAMDLVGYFAPPSAETPSSLSSSSMSLPVEITNESIFPIFNLHYYCYPESTGLLHISGSTVFLRGPNWLDPKHKSTMRCDKAFDLDIPIEKASFTVTVEYETIPYWSRSVSFTFEAIVGKDGRITRWLSKK